MFPYIFIFFVFSFALCNPIYTYLLELSFVVWKVQFIIFVIVCYGIQKLSSSHRFRTMGLDRAYVMTGRSLYLAIYGSKFEFDSKTACKFPGLLQQIFKGFAQNNTKARSR